MSRLLDQLIARESGERVLTRTDIEREEAAMKAKAVAATAPLGRRVLAWCDAHQAECQTATKIVERLRSALREGDYISPTLIDLYGEVPDAMSAEEEEA